MDKNIKAFITYFINLTIRITIYPVKKAQKLLLLIEKINISVEYSDFTNIFSKKFNKGLLKFIEVYEYSIELEKSKKSFCGLIYSLRLIEVKIFKTYIETYLANSFIRLSKLLVKILILIIQKCD